MTTPFGQLDELPLWKGGLYPRDRAFVDAYNDLSRMINKPLPFPARAAFQFIIGWELKPEFENYLLETLALIPVDEENDLHPYLDEKGNIIFRFVRTRIFYFDKRVETEDVTSRRIRPSEQCPERPCLEVHIGDEMATAKRINFLAFERVKISDRIKVIARLLHAMNLIIPAEAIDFEKAIASELYDLKLEEQINQTIEAMARAQIGKEKPAPFKVKLFLDYWHIRLSRTGIYYHISKDRFKDDIKLRYYNRCKELGVQS